MATFSGNDPPKLAKRDTARTNASVLRQVEDFFLNSDNTDKQIFSGATIGETLILVLEKP